MKKTDYIEVGDPLPVLKRVKALEPWRVGIVWAGGPKGEQIIDLAPIVLAYRHFKPLREDTKLFSSVKVGDDGSSLVWGEEEDEIEMSAAAIERLAEEAMQAQDFSAFLKRHRLTFDAAAAELGISRRLVAYYAEGREIPRYIALACAYIDMREAPKAS